MNEESLQSRISKFLNGHPHAVIGASADRAKFGNKVLRAYMQAGREVVPVHPRETEIEGLSVYATLEALPHTVHGISVVTPPAITKKVVQSAIELGIKNVWMQPGTFSDDSVALALASGLTVIAGEACILVVLGFSDRK